MSRQIAMLFGLLIAAFFFSVQAKAQTKLVFDTNGNIVGSYVDRVNVTEGDTLGVRDKTSGKVRVPAGGKTISVPFGADKLIPKSAIAGAATAAKRLAGPIGIAWTAYDLYKAVEESGIQTCPPPEFFCKPGTVVSGSDGYFWQVYGYASFGNADGWRQAAILWSNSNVNPGVKGQYCSWKISDTQYNLGPRWSNNTCGAASGSVVRTTQCVNASCTPTRNEPTPYTDVELEQAFKDKLDSDPEFSKKYYDALWRDYQRNEALKGDVQLITPETPVTVNAPPVTTPKRVVSSTTREKPDGTTETETVEEQTTVTPQVSGSTVGDTSITFKSQTVQTTTVVNNTTNQTTTNTTVVNNYDTESEDTDDAFVDSDMPEVPELYTQKYPDGIAGVWNDHKPDITSTQFWQGIRSMFPTFGAGSCPAWSMTFSIIPTVANYGSMPFDVPCWIFQAIGLIILTTAAFTARKIIF